MLLLKRLFVVLSVSILVVSAVKDWFEPLYSLEPTASIPRSVEKYTEKYAEKYTLQEHACQYEQCRHP